MTFVLMYIFKHKPTLLAKFEANFKHLFYYKIKKYSFTKISYINIWSIPRIIV